MKKGWNAKNMRYRSIMLLLILSFMLQLAYLHQARAQYTRVDHTDSNVA
jgi:hypothetical protein